tara:strand:+ start:138 stop:374 length:237 start_codon:yes stop_codon:yes gene_type:complete
MAKQYAKSLKEYEEPVEIDSDRLLEAMKRVKGRRKPTSVALDEETIKELKKIATKLNVPYQVLMRVFILDGLKKLKAA